MTRDTEITREIGAILWSIFPPEAARIEFVGWYYSTGYGYQGGPTWFDSDGNRLGPKAYTPDLLKLCHDIAALFIELQQTPPFENAPFSHVKYVLGTDGKMDLTFKYIPEWVTWTGLFLRGVSDLTEAELIAVGIPTKDWEACCKRRVVENYS